MSNSQRLMNQGLLAELRNELVALENRAENYIAAIQSATFVVESPLNLDGGNIVVAAQDLDRVIREAAKVRGRIDQLEDELGL